MNLAIQHLRAVRSEVCMIGVGKRLEAVVQRSVAVILIPGA